MAAISLLALREYCHYLVVSSNIRRKRRQDEEGKQSDEAAIRDLVLTIDLIHKWRLFYFCSVIVQISLPSLTLEQEFFSI